MSIFTRTLRCPECGNGASVRDDKAFQAAFEKEVFASWRCRRCDTVLIPKLIGQTLAVPGEVFDAQIKDLEQVQE